jgi:hypothetical protein
MYADSVFLLDVQTFVVGALGCCVGCALWSAVRAVVAVALRG